LDIDIFLQQRTSGSFLVIKFTLLYFIDYWGSSM
jgi:hypothetical protein